VVFIVGVVYFLTKFILSYFLHDCEWVWFPDFFLCLPVTDKYKSYQFLKTVTLLKMFIRTVSFGFPFFSLSLFFFFFVEVFFFLLPVF
jgi:hypothetical protein